MILVRKTNSNNILQICKNEKFLYFVNRNKDTLFPAKLYLLFFPSTYCKIQFILKSVWDNQFRIES